MLNKQWLVLWLEEFYFAFNIFNCPTVKYCLTFSITLKLLKYHVPILVYCSLSKKSHLHWLAIHKANVAWSWH